MPRLQLDAILKLVGVQIDPAVFKQISQSTAGMSVNLTASVNQINRANQGAGQLNSTLKQTQATMTGVDRLAAQFFQRMAQFAVLLPTFATLNHAIQGGAKFIVDFQKAVIDIIKIDPTELADKFNKISDAAFNIGISLGASADKVVETIKIFKQAGLTFEESQKDAAAAILLTNVGTIDLNGSIELILGTLKQFSDEGLSAADVVDKISKASDLAAVNEQDFAEAFKAGGNALAFATGSINETIGLISALREQTRKSGSEIGTFFKTLSTRILAAGQSRSAIEALGVTVADAAGNFRPLIDILGDLKSKFNDLTQEEQANAAKVIGGVRQFESLIATLNSLDRANEISAATANASGTALTKQAIVAKSLAYQIEQAKAEFQKLAQALGESGVGEFFGKAINTATQFATVLGKVVEIAGQLGVAIGPLAAVGAIKLGQTIFGGRNQGGNPQISSSVTGPTSNALNQLTTSAQKAATALSSIGVAPGANVGAGRFASNSSQNVTIKNQTAIQQGFLNQVNNSTLAQQQAAAASQAQAKASSETAVKFALLAGTQVALSSVTRLLTDSTTAAGKALSENAKSAIKTANDALQVGLSFALLGGKAGFLAGIFVELVGATAHLIQSFKDNDKAKEELKKSSDLDSSFKELSDKLRTGDKPIISAITSIFQNNLNAKGGFDFNAIFKQLNEQLKTTNGPLSQFKGLADTDKLKEVIGNDFIKAFSEATGVEDAVKAFADNNVANPLQEALKALAKNFGANPVKRQFSKGGIGLKNPLIDEEDNIGSAAEESAKFLEKLIDKEGALRSARVESLNVLSSQISTIHDEVASLENEVKVKESIKNQADVLKNKLADSFRIDPAALGKNNVDQVNKLLQELDETINSVGGDTQNAILSFVNDKKLTKNQQDALLKLIDLSHEQQKAANDLAESEKKLNDKKLQDVIDFQKIQSKAFEEGRKAIEDVRAEFISLGADVNGTVFKDLQNLNSTEFDAILNDLSDAPERIQTVVKAFSGDEVAKAQLALNAAMENGARKIELFKNELLDVSQELERVTKTGAKQSIETGRTPDELKARKATLEQTIGAEELKVLAETGKRKLDLLGEESKAAKKKEEKDKQAIKHANELADASKKLSEALRDTKLKFEDLIKEQVSSQLSKEASAQDELKTAQQGVMEATKGLAEAYANVNAAIIAYNDTVAAARIESNKLSTEIGGLTGGLVTFQDKLGSLQNGFTSVLKDANISLQQRINLEKQLAQDTLSFLQQAQSEIVSAGTKVFGQSPQENANLQQGIAGLQVIVDKLGGSFKAFQNFDSNRLNAVSNELLNLPQDLRQKILDALGTLPGTVSIGGFSKDQLQTAIGQIGAGVAPQAGLPSIADLSTKQVEALTKIQELTLRQADLSATQISTSVQQLAAAQTQVDVAKIAEERARQQIDEIRKGFAEETDVLLSAANQRDTLANAIIGANDRNTLELITAQAEKFATQNETFKEIGQQLVEAIRGIASARASVLDQQIQNGVTGFIPNFAHGNLSVREVAGLISAASREKKAMPGGSRLAIANTSEAIIPMRNAGFIPNFASGNADSISAGIAAGQNINETVAAAIARSLSLSLNDLIKNTSNSGNGNNDRVVELLDSISKDIAAINGTNVLIQTGITDLNTTVASNATVAPTTTQAGGVSIDLTTNQQSTVNVTGLDSLVDQIRVAVQTATEQQVNAQLGPILESITSALQVLRERGLISSFGQPA